MTEEADLDALVTAGLASLPITKAELVAMLISWATRIGNEDVSLATRVSALEAAKPTGVFYIRTEVGP